MLCNDYRIVVVSSYFMRVQVHSYLHNRFDGVLVTQ